MANRYRLKKVDHINYTEADWNEYWEFRKKSYELKKEPMPFDSLDQLKQLNVTNIRESGEAIYQVWKNDIENGILCFSIEFKEDSHKRFTYLESYMNDQSLEAGLLELIFEEFLEYDEASKSLAIHSRDGLNDYVEEMFDAAVGANAAWYELNINEAKQEKIEAWLSEAPNKFPKLRIVFYQEIPDELLEEYATLFTQFANDIPVPPEIGDNTCTAASVKSYQEAIKLRSHTNYIYLVFNEDNQMIALTNVSVNLKQTQSVDQSMTGVRADYRGRGLSKWLKSAMFTKLVADFPDLEVIETEAHPDNLPSIQMSKQMGFKRTGAHKDYVISREKIIQHLSHNSKVTS